MGTSTATTPTLEQYTDFAKAASALLCELPEWRDAEPDARRDKIIDLATNGAGSELSDIIYLSDALAKVRAFVNIELSTHAPAPAPRQETVASDWLASVTPNRNGDFVSPGGMRFNFTMHDGATAAMALSLILEADRAFRMFAEYGIRLYEAPAAQPVTPPVQPQGASSTTTQHAPAGDGAGYEVFGVGRCQPGKTYEVQITRVKPGATLNNSPTLDMYRPGDKFRFLTVFERQFGEFEERTGINPTTMNPREEVTVNLKVFFRLATDAEGKVKTTDKGNPRIDFAGIA